jgi:hypothetical protein
MNKFSDPGSGINHAWSPTLQCALYVLIWINFVRSIFYIIIFELLMLTHHFLKNYSHGVIESRYLITGWASLINYPYPWWIMNNHYQAISAACVGAKGPRTSRCFTPVSVLAASSSSTRSVSSSGLGKSNQTYGIKNNFLNSLTILSSLSRYLYDIHK